MSSSAEAKLLKNEEATANKVKTLEELEYDANDSDLDEVADDSDDNDLDENQSQFIDESNNNDNNIINKINKPNSLRNSPNIESSDNTFNNNQMESSNLLVANERQDRNADNDGSLRQQQNNDPLQKENSKLEKINELSPLSKDMIENYHNLIPHDKDISLKCFLTKNERLLHAMSAQTFTQFESMLFDLIGFPPTTPLKLDEALKEPTDLSKLDEIDTQDTSVCLIPNMSILNEQLEMSVFDEMQLNKFVSLKHNQSNKQSSTSKSSSAKTNASRTKPTDLKNNKDPIEATSTSTSTKQYKTKVITVILNQSTRPRKAYRILLNRRNTSSLDIFLNELCFLFKMDNQNSKKLFKLDGTQVTNVADLLDVNTDALIFAIDKLHLKDLELDQEEIDKFFANELMGKIPSYKLAKLNERNTQRRNSTRSSKKGKENTANLIDSTDDGISMMMPEELLNNYDIGNVIGEGHFALVRECKDINTGFSFALKIIDLKKCIGKENMIENELKILRKVKHPNIIKLVEEYKSDNYFYLIMEYLKGGDLLETITVNGKIPEREASKMVHNLASAIAYLHSNRIVHRDIKLENILITKFSEDNKILKLGDFGLATLVDKPLNQKCGSPIYVAPEILLGKSYEFEVDVWSLGVIAYILLCGFAPFQGDTDEETFEKIKTSELKFPNPYWEGISDDAKNLIAQMLDRNQETRIKSSDILDNKWILQDLKLNSSSINADNGRFVFSGSTKINPSKASSAREPETKNLLDSSRNVKNYKISNFGRPPKSE